MQDPENRKSIDELSFVVGKEIVPLAVPPVDLEAALGTAYVAARRGERYFTGPRYDGPAPASTGMSVAEFVPVRKAAESSAEAEPAAATFEIPDLDLSRPPPAVGASAPSPRVAPAATPRRSKSTQGTGPLVLVVDDEAEIAGLMSEWLGTAGYRVVVAGDAESAVELLKQQPPDLMVLDAVLPGLHGFDLVRRLKASRRYEALPIVMVSGLHCGWSLEADLRAFGVVDYLQKPIRAAQLVRAAAKALGQKPRGVRSAAAECLQAGLLAFQQGDVDRALAQLVRATEIDPDAPELHFHLGLLRGQRGQVFEAIASLERAMELDGRDFPTIKNLAVLYLQAGFSNRSRELWQRALHQAPDDATRASIGERLRTLGN
jgi:DNA-binding response OmpR family regulator